MAVFGTALSTGKVVLCGLPLFHVNAQLAPGLRSGAQGGHVILGTPQGYRTPGLIQKFWDIAAHHKITSFSGVPTFY
jgi:fatty-acyl-CoA synthase